MSAPVVIVHGEDGEEIAGLLEERVRGRGFPVYRSAHVLAGESLIGEVGTRIALGGPVVLCLSVQVVGLGIGPRVLDAVRAVQARGVPQRLIPVRAGPCYLQPFLLALDGVKVVDCCDGRFETGAAEVLRALGESPAEPPRAPDLDAEVHRYVRRLTTDCEHLPMLGFRKKVRMPLRHEQMYVRLRARLHDRLTEDEQVAGAALLRESSLWGGGPEGEQTVDLQEVVALTRRAGRRGAVILGEPGSGKSTLLQHLVTAFGGKDGPARFGLPEGTVPILIRLRDVARPEDGLLAALTDALRLPSADLADPAATARVLLHGRPLLLLIDGLDEVRTEEVRAAVARWLEREIQSRDEVFFAVTCREEAYRGEARLDGRFLELHVCPLDEVQGRQLIGNWYHVVESRPELGREPAAARAVAEQATKDLGDRIFRSDDRRTGSLRSLAGYPMLLQILCVVHKDRDGGRLPERRAELYEECVHTLLEQWRGPLSLAKDVELSARQSLRLLQPLAWHLQVLGRPHDAAATLGDLLAAPLRALGRQPAEATRFLKAAREQAGVLASFGTGSVGFLHKSFQEYLAARDVQDRLGSDPAAIGPLADHFGEPEWRETILLAIALDNPSPFEPLMAALIEAGVLEKDPQLADDCVADALSRTPLPFLRALECGIADETARYHAMRLLRRIPGTEEAVLPSGRTGAELLAAIAREPAHSTVTGGEATRRTTADVAAELTGTSVRERVNERDGTVLVYVPGGVYPMGAADLTDDERPVHEVRLAPTWIGKYPVTNAQYARFLEANPRAPKPMFWGDKQWSGSEQPVIGVSWNEAVTYCKWAGLLLPTEAQWEAAARGPDGRRYPWGDADPDQRRANFGGKLGRTSPVDAYPDGAGPFGTLDQAGNVWEWCLDVWGSSAYRGRERTLVDNPVNNDGDADVRPLRGGSWYDPAEVLRAAYRLGSRARLRDGIIGFRCVWPSPAEP